MDLDNAQIAKIGYVIFGGYHSYDDFKMLLKSYEVELPKEKTFKYESPFTDGTVDYTSKFVSTPKCSNRKIKLVFKIVEITAAEWVTLYNNMNKNLHNKRFDKIYLSTLESYYSGKVTIDSVRSNYLEKTITITVDALPYSLACVANSTFKITFSTGSQSKSWSIPTAFTYKTNNGDIIYATSDNALYLTVPATWIEGVSSERIDGDMTELGEIIKYTSSVSTTVESAGYLESSITLMAFRKVTA